MLLILEKGRGRNIDEREMDGLPPARPPLGTALAAWVRAAY